MEADITTLAVADKIDFAKTSPKERATLDLLVRLNQTHLLQNWQKGSLFQKKREFLSQLAGFEASLVGGLKAYLETSKKLLESIEKKKTPLEGWVPEIPLGETLKFGSKRHFEIEKLGLRTAANTGFILVSGGIGERLKYLGIKLGIKAELCTEKTFLELYIRSILAIQKRARDMDPKGHERKLFLAIMTSEDTDEQTRTLLSKNENFGMHPDQITILKQKKVPCVLNSDVKLAPMGDFAVRTKPHGHGDVHSLIYKTKTIEKWAASGVKSIVFFQDTNTLLFKAIPALIGKLTEGKQQMAFLAIPRLAGEAVGSLCSLVRKPDSLCAGSGPGKKTCCIEYNQFDALLKDAGVIDEKDKNGYSSFPGNTNVFALGISAYLEALKTTRGEMREFINPKMSEKRTEPGKAGNLGFLSPARLECLMQDIVWGLPEGTEVEYVLMERWMCFSPAKYCLSAAREKQVRGEFPMSIASAESDLYYANRRYLEELGAEVKPPGSPESSTDVSGGSEAKTKPLVLIDPEFSLGLADLKGRVEGLKMTNRSSIVLSGANSRIQGLDLDGCLVLSTSGARVKDLKVSNQGWRLLEIKEFEAETVDAKARGHVIVKKEQFIV